MQRLGQWTRPLLRLSQSCSARGCRALNTTSGEVSRLLDTYSVDRLGPQPGDEAVLTLSGGVDSSVAAFVALERGKLNPVRTIFMRNWNSLDEGAAFEPGSGGGSTGCHWLRDWHIVEKTAQVLGVKPELMDLSNEYWNRVFQPALEDWQRGTTPNPDVDCNREIKFGELLLRAGFANQTKPGEASSRRRWLVTGHYARLSYYQIDGDLKGRLHRAMDTNKDQSYFLSAVPSDKLGRAHFPLANLTKTEVRAIASHLGLPTASSEESMGLCFVGERGGGGHARFLDSYIDAQPGNLISGEDGRVVGKHSGLHTLTVGQGARIGGASQRWFVAAKNIDTNEIVVVPGADHALLRCQSLSINAFHSIVSDPDYNSLQGRRLLAQIRHRQEPVACIVKVLVTNEQPTLHVIFDEAIVGVAQGQTCALYDSDECLGSGVINDVSCPSMY